MSHASILHTFGGLTLVGGGGEPLRGAATQRRRLALLAVVAASEPAGISRDKLMSLFWPESDEGSARRALNQALYALRASFGADDLFLGTLALRLNPAAIESDVADFLHSLEQGNLARAAELYRGPFLDGVHVANAPEFERWLEGERESLHRRFVQAVSELSETARRAGETATAVHWSRRRAAAEPLDPVAILALMRVLADAGDVPGALQQARVYSARVEAELGFPPDERVTKLAGELRSAALARRSPPSSAPAHDPLAKRAAAAAPQPTETDRAADAAASPLSEPAPTAPTLDAPRRSRWRTLALAGIALGAVAVAGSALLTASRRRDVPSIDDRVLVVAPFTVIDPSLALWREGMVDLLSRALDGAGPVRTVSPIVAMRHAGQGAQALDATELAHATGARVVLTGSVVRAGLDSVRIAVSLLDARDGTPLGAVERRGPLARMDLLTDSLTLDVLRELDEWVPLGGGRRAELSRMGASRSVEALKAFLRGEHYYRQARWDSAVTFYTHALRHDSTFALAAWRLGTTLSWRRFSADSASQAYRLRAGAMNRGLGTRDSLLVAADSLVAASDQAATLLEAWPFTRRLFVVLDSAVARYPEDPEVWHAVGEARYHFASGPLIGVADSVTLAAFDRAIALDSAFAPAYVHTPELALMVRGRDAARQYVRAYLALGAEHAEHRGLELMALLLTPNAARSPAVTRTLDTISADALFPARTALRRWPDADESALRLTRLLLTPGRRSSYEPFVDSASVHRLLAEQLAFRGHLRESAAVARDADMFIHPELAYLGTFPPAVADTALRRRMQAGSRWMAPALAYWSARRDTATLLDFLDGARARLGAATGPTERSKATYDTAAAEAHLALARRDTAGALARFAALPDTLCPRCYVDRLTRGQLLLARGRTREALRAFSEPLVALQSPVEVLFALWRARAATRLRDRATAERAYRFVADAWVHADPALQPFVLEARQALAR